MSNPLNCPVCNVLIPDERVQCLKDMNYAEHDIYCVKHALNRIPKAVYTGEHGTSDLIICDRVYSDSVRSKLLNAEDLSDDSDDDEDESSEFDK